MNQTKGKRFMYSTTIQFNGAHFAVLAETPYKLNDAINAITNGAIYCESAHIDRVLLTPANFKPKAAHV